MESHRDEPNREDAKSPGDAGESAAAIEGTGEEVVSKDRSVNAFWASVAAVLGLVVIMMLTGRFDSLARDFVRLFESAPAPAEVVTETGDRASDGIGLFAFEGLDIHPDLVFRPYTAGEMIGSDVSTTTARMIEQFRELLDLYEERQAIDDNFTVRVVDNRTNEVLEVYELSSERDKFEQSGSQSWNWGRVDQMRRTATRNLVQKYASRGIPRPAITVKWGRRNQVLGAREREHPFIEYEVRLARYLGLSLLATEIGTVETFNDDRLVSPVGARSRYQMMPYVLRQNDVRHYRISTAAGNSVEVYEEWHPLLTMEPAFTTLTGYKNAVGHEIPGISAYHTGPGNIYMVYRMFLTENTGLFSPSSTVVDAYMWAVTTGYDQVSRSSSFKSYSRGYVASAYGALRATEDLPIDSTRTVEAERVQVKPDKHVFLSELIRAFESSEQELDWGPEAEDMSTYDRFRFMNTHISLPSSDASGVDPRVDVRLSAESQGVPVRFFLPLGAVDVLKEAGHDVIDESATFRFTHSTYGRPQPGDVTIWDRQYENLVRDIAGFGFTNENRTRLNFLVSRFRELAEANPSHYRQIQLEIIRTHQRIWQSNVFNKLASAVSAAHGRLRTDPRPPTDLPVSARDSGLSG